MKKILLIAVTMLCISKVNTISAHNLLGQAKTCQEILSTYLDNQATLNGMSPFGDERAEYIALEREQVILYNQIQVCRAKGAYD